MDRKFTFSVDEFYHVYSRGVEKRIVFENDLDYTRFQKLLYFCNRKEPMIFRLVQGLPLYRVEKGERLVDVVAYALMPNHIHLVIREIEDGGISKYMGKVMTAYSMYFNKKCERTGPLFMRPFRAKHIDNDPYFRWIFSYVHLNPISMVEGDWEKDGIRNRNKVRIFLNNYKYSSFYDYSVADRTERYILSFEETPEFLIEQNDLEDLIKWHKNEA
jgi:REP element-mobilizing transposase RayT